MTDRAVLEVDQRIEALYGASSAARLAEGGGVVHVTAVWRRPDGRYKVLVIREDTPKSPTDAFVLRLARARADAIVVTGRILREEPSVTFGVEHDGVDLRRWREIACGKPEPPVLAVLTSGRTIDFSHPAYRSPWVRPRLYTSAMDVMAPVGVRVVQDPQADLRRLLGHLRAEGHGTILVEAGPSTARALYDPPRAVDELMLSVLEADAVPEGVEGGDFFDERVVPAMFEASSAPVRCEENGRTWWFSRFTARR